MGISNEASVNPFSVGPPIKIGRTMDFRFFLAMVPVISWFHPRNTHGIMVMVILIACLLRWCTNVLSWAESAFRRKFWRNMMKSALTYEEWKHAAKMLEKEMPTTNESDLYDEELIKNKIQELRHRRQEGSLRDIMFSMRGDLLRNFGNMCNPQLHQGRLQVPKLIKEYIGEVATQLKMMCDSNSDGLLLEEKLAFMHETRHAFGRTALLLSGGGSLGAFHIGVMKTLVEKKLLPQIVAGSSAGSIMCAIVATRTWPELESFFEDFWQSLRFFGEMGGIFSVIRRVMKHGAVHDIGHLQRLLRNITNNLTFQEAFDKTGRILGITVCSPRKHEPPRCLNYLTSPHVVIWSAVTASCAFPGMFEAQELMAKDRFAELVPFHEPVLDGSKGTTVPVTSARLWRDGSLESDLPITQLRELFNVNHFIVSQANPHIAPFLRLKELMRAYGGNFAAKLANVAELEFKHRFSQMLVLGFPFGMLAKVFAQNWEGDVTVVMPATLAQYSKIIQNPSFVELQMACNQGRRCTWEKLSSIRANCAIELALDESVVLLNHMRVLNRKADRATVSHRCASALKFSASLRIPSWNCIARKNSVDSNVEHAVSDHATSSRKGTRHTHRGRLPRRNYRAHSNIHDICNSKSETAELNSWTRSDGPLQKNSNFIHKIDVSELRQPEWIQNGFVFDVVGKGDQTSAPQYRDSEKYL